MGMQNKNFFEDSLTTETHNGGTIGLSFLTTKKALITD